MAKKNNSNDNDKYTMGEIFKILTAINADLEDIKSKIENMKDDSECLEGDFEVIKAEEYDYADDYMYDEDDEEEDVPAKDTKDTKKNLDSNSK